MNFASRSLDLMEKATEPLNGQILFSPMETNRVHAG